MPHLLAFLYQPGESLVYETVLTSVYKSIEGEKSEKRLRIRIETEVLEAQGDVYRCRARTHLLEADPQAGPWAVFSQNRSGKILSQENPDSPVSPDLFFPSFAVDVDDYWEVSDQAGPSSPTPMELQVESFVQRGEELVAVLSCGGEAEVDEGAASALIEGTIHFSVTRGRKLWSRILCSLAWQNGRKVDSTEETTYLDIKAP